MVTTSPEQTFPDAHAKEQEPYWVEIQLVDEEGKAVTNIPWRAENNATASGHEKELKGKSDATGLIRVEPRYGSELTLILDAQPLADEMEKRYLRVSREPEESLVRASVENDGYIWHYAVVGELCNKLPKIESRKGEPYAPDFHFPPVKSLKGFKIRTNELEKRHVIEICPFRAWELVLHHQNDYSMANAINLGAAASLAYADDNAFDTESITRFFINQCQDLSKVPQLHKGEYLTNTLVKDVPFSQRYYPPVFMDTSRETTGSDGKDNQGSSPKNSESIKAEGDTQIFYVYNDEKIIISWRGTASLYDVGTDLAFRPIETESCDISKVQCTTLFPKGKVHEGFWNGYCRVERKFSSSIDEMLRLIKVRELFICGHSLGGALALINAVALKSEEPLLYTYGMPRTFTRDAIEQLPNLIHFRHVNDNDPVPAVPPEANVDNEFYKLWGPVGAVLGGVWSSFVQLPLWQIIEWGDCFWHHGNPVVFLTTTQSREWKDCKISLPEPAGCITLKRLLPIKTKLYLLPALAEQMAQKSGQEQKEFNASLTKKDLEQYFPQGKNPDRGADLTFGDHFMTTYMPYINNKFLELITLKGLSPCQSFNEHQDNLEAFKNQMNENKIEIPESEFKRNEIFLKLEDLLNTSINPTLTLDKGDVVLQRFALYGEEEIENA